MKLFDRDDYRNSFLDGMYANVYGTLTSGAFLTGFALYLEMDDLMIGLVMAIPFIVTLFQLPGSYYICRKGRRKTIALGTATIARLLWLPMLAIGLLPFNPTPLVQISVLMIFLVLQSFSSVSYIAWISWTSDLVPDEIRGAFFGTRNMLCGAAGIAAILIFGNLIDIFNSGSGRSPLLFVVPFGFAVLFGLISSIYLNRISDIPAPAFNGKSFFQELAGPFRDSNFRKYLLFTLCWNFSVHMAAPFFALYFLRELNYSYGFVAMLTTIAALVDMFTAKFWGALSDQIKNKTVMQVTGWGVVFLPALWVWVRPEDFILPVVIQILSGGFWAGFGLCGNNLLLRISPQEDRVWFISANSIIAGLGAALAPIVGGVILNLLNHATPAANAGGILPLHYLFMASSLLRMLSLLLFGFIHEPQEKSFRQAVQMFFSMRHPRPVGLKKEPAAMMAAMPSATPKMHKWARP
jgi:MFS family permease